MFVKIPIAQALPVFVMLAACSGGSAQQNSAVETREGPLVYISDGVTLTLGLESDSIHITLSAPTTGWVSVGFKPTRAMKDADIYIGYVMDGEVFLRDDFGTGNTSHAPDTSLGGQSSFAGLSGTEVDGVTTISFVIARNSGDRYDAVLTGGETHKVILGYGPDGADDFTTYHRWVKTVNLTL